MIELAALAVAAAATTTTIDYPAFARRPGPIEAVIEKGAIVEMIVRCPAGTGILSYSKADRRYCSSRNACFATFTPALRDTCR